MQLHTPDIRFDSQVVLVTGAGRGLGHAYAMEFARRGARVVVHDAGVDKDGQGGDETVAESVVQEIVAEGGLASPAFQNLASKSGCDDLITSTVQSLGRIDVLICNAGIVRFIPDGQLDEQTAANMMAVNAMASLWLTIAVRPHLVRQGYGRIVYTLSGHGTMPADAPNDLAIYGMSKAAVFGVMNISAGSFGNANVAVNAISPVAATRVLVRPVTGDELAAEKVTPAVILLASSDWTTSGTIISAADGRFGLRRIVTEKSLTADDHDGTPEALRRRWLNN